MGRAHALLVAAALAALPACNAIIGLKSVEESSPDAAIGASCEVNERYELLQASEGTVGTSLSMDANGAVTFALALNVDSATDFFFLMLRPGLGGVANPIQVGKTYTISGAETKLETCGVCALLAVNFTGAFDGDDFYVASSGEVELMSVSGRLMAKLTNLKFRHVSVGVGTVDAADGCKSQIQSVLINMPFGSTGSPDAGVPDAGPTTTVTGTVINNRMTENGEVTVPLDASRATIEALLLNGNDFSSYTGVGKADGSFTIQTPPAAQRYIRVGSTYLLTGELATDFGQTNLGRADGVMVPRETAYFHVELGNADEIKAEDFFELYIPNLDILGFLEGNVGSKFYEEDIWTTPAVEAAKTDTVYIAQLAGRTTAMGDPYLALSRLFKPALFTTMQDQTTDIPAADFQTVDPTFFATLDWRRMDFHALQAAVNPLASLSSDGLSISAVPFGPRVDLQIGNAVDLFYSSRKDDTNINFGAVPVGNPFPATWEKWLDHRSIFNVPYKANGATENVNFRAGISRFDPLASLDGQPIQPAVYPVKSPRINGTDAFSPQSGVGATPNITWEQPQGPAPSGYRVALYELYNENGTSNFTYQSQVVTTGLAIKYPPGWLKNNRTYFFRITSFLTPAANLTRAPLRRGLPAAEADTVSGVLTP